MLTAGFTSGGGTGGGFFSAGDASANNSVTAVHPPRLLIPALVIESCSHSSRLTPRSANPGAFLPPAQYHLTTRRIVRIKRCLKQTRRRVHSAASSRQIDYGSDAGRTRKIHSPALLPPRGAVRLRRLTAQHRLLRGSPRSVRGHPHHRSRR